MIPRSIDELRAALTQLTRRVEDLRRGREEAVQQAALRRQEAEAQTKALTKAAEAEREAARRTYEERLGREIERIDAESEGDGPRIERAYANACAKVRKELKAELGRLDQEQERKKQQALRGQEDKYAPQYQQASAIRERVRNLRGRINLIKKRVDASGADLGLETTKIPLAAIEKGPPLDEVEQAVIDVESELQVTRGRAWFKFAGSSPLVILSILSLLIHGGALLGAGFMRDELLKRMLMITPATFAASLLAIWLFCAHLKRRARARVQSLQEGLGRVVPALRPYEKTVRGNVERIGKTMLDEHVQIVNKIRDAYDARGQEAKAAADAELEALELKRDGLIERSRQAKEERVRRAEAALKPELEAALTGIAAGLREKLAPHEATLRDIAAHHQETLDGMEREQKAAIDEARSAADAAVREGRERFPAWTDPYWKGVKLPSKFPDSVPVGNVTFDLASILGDEGLAPVVFPLGLSFPAQGSCLFTVPSDDRARALEGLQSVLLRILSAFPPGKAKLLIVDPVGLGQSFSALMHLADFGDSIVGGRIWTESSHIERKLSELTEHIEKVIQKYLRNRYASVAEFNRDAGQLAEAYRFLVIADYPSGFSELALERLSSIVASGPRCAVYTIIHHDRRVKADVGRLRANGPVIGSNEDGLVVADDELKHSPVTIERPPEPAALTSMLQTVGKQIADAGRVELDFELAAPRGAATWSLKSEGGLRIPIGKADAERLQHMELGRGTAQHALIAGKTGSGKSTLLHVMITNAALWYGPRELELYLIDFKKGVEFKTYASHGLPHARVVAVESDREFGLSVLHRIDQELTRRGEAFRKAGVQDFASFRKAGGDEYLPRSLLVIDEFQEFFTEEDAIAQEAALLLDRIVRQGRAFGVHVILGSQTLGGTYTLARATLGQMGVRIALQCSEADSYLILSDDNAAARLLSRPGEAIYNDQSGLVEGNNPFQVVWLPDESKDRHLDAARERAEREGYQPREATVVFEGNIPADIRSNEFLSKRLAKPYAAKDEHAMSVWLGEANAIKGPTEVKFRRRGGGNLLVVGQHRESALGIILSSVAGLALAHKPGSARFVLLDGSPPELGYGRWLSELTAALPHGIELVDFGKVPEAMAELDAEVKGRLDGSRKSESPVFLFICDLQRFRKLRVSEDYGMGGEEGAAPTADKCFANVLEEGPLQGVHSIVWCDSLTNLNRAIARKSMREFEMRVLFQMSATDSSELIDSPLASKLGLYRAMLYSEEEGTIEKFRPYGLPDAAWLEAIRKAVGKSQLSNPNEIPSPKSQKSRA